MATCSETSLESLPGELLARVFSTLSPAHLHWVETICRRFRAVVVQYELWYQSCISSYSPIGALASRVDLSTVPAPGQDSQKWLPAEAARRSAFFKRLHYRLSAPLARESLIATAISASSTDHPQESVDNLLSPEARSRNLLCYWSSAGSEDEDSVEVLTFALAHPLCVVRQVDLRPFKAFFQWEEPIYAPKAVRFRLGGVDCYRPDGTPLPCEVLAQAVQQQRLMGAEAAAAGGAGAAAAGLAAGAGAGGAAVGQPAAFAFAPGAVPAAMAADVELAVEMGAGVMVGPGVMAGGVPLASYVGGAQVASGVFVAGDEVPQHLPPRFVWESPVFPVQQADELQAFQIEPTLCVGGLLQVELIGKVQRQEPDQLLYTCLAYVRALGVPLCNFRVAPAAQEPIPRDAPQPVFQAPEALGGALDAAAQAQVQGGVVPAARPQAQQGAQQVEAPFQLQYVASDVLEQAGGLARVSEGGRVWRLQQRLRELEGLPALQGGQDGEESMAGSDEDLWGGSETDSGEDDAEAMLFGSDSDVDWDEGHPFAD